MHLSRLQNSWRNTRPQSWIGDRYTFFFVKVCLQVRPVMKSIPQMCTTIRMYNQHYEIHVCNMIFALLFILGMLFHGTRFVPKPHDIVGTFRLLVLSDWCTSLITKLYTCTGANLTWLMIKLRTYFKLLMHGVDKTWKPTGVDRAFIS